MKSTLRYFLITVITTLLLGTTSLAAEVTPVSAVLYTTEGAKVFADDEGKQLLTTFTADLPVQVIGITDTGLFQVDLGSIFYIAGDGLTQKQDTDSSEIKTKNGFTQQQVYEILIAQKSIFPEGLSWTNDNYYSWNGGTFSGGFGCAGFVFALSDAAFGTEKAIIHTDYNNIKVGDILRINNDTHSVIVLEVHDAHVIVSEGNYNGAVHWGRKIENGKLSGYGNYIMTRY